jgi:hypothetical protein
MKIIIAGILTGGNNMGKKEFSMEDAVRFVNSPAGAQLLEMLPDAEVYTLLREGFRGGNTHANRWYAGDIIPGVYGQDLCSAYPAAMILYKYPMKPFFHEGPVTLERLMDLLQHKHKALLFRICFYDIKLISRYTGAPYLARDKCRNIQGGRFDNGRILEADYLETTITDLDFRIIMKHCNHVLQ